jgi:hypothetical protein
MKASLLAGMRKGFFERYGIGLSNAWIEDVCKSHVLKELKLWQTLDSNQPDFFTCFSERRYFTFWPFFFGKKNEYASLSIHLIGLARQLVKTSAHTF